MDVDVHLILATLVMNVVRQAIMQETAGVGVGDEVEVADTNHAVAPHTDGDALGLDLGVVLLPGPGQGLVPGPALVMGETLLDIPAVEAGTGAGVETGAGLEHQLKEVQDLTLALLLGPGMSEESNGRFKCNDFASYCFFSSCGGIHESNMATHGHNCCYFGKCSYLC